MRSRLLAPVLALAAVLGVVSTGAVPAGAATSVEGPGSEAAVAAAQSQVDALRAQVEAATAELLAGTQALEEGRARLAAVRADADRTRAAAEQAQREAEAARAQLAVIVRQDYTRPTPSDLQLVLGAQRGAALTDAALASAELKHVRGDQQDVLRTADAKRVEAEGLVVEAEQLEAEAAAEEQRIAVQVSDLQRRAGEIEVQLSAAAAQLEAAEAARAAALEEEARLAAAAAAAARRPVVSSAVIPTCDGGTSTAAYANGFLPASALCPIGVPGHALRADAAAAFKELNAAYGGGLCVTDSYRSYAAQVDVYQRKPGLAAVPGTSNHGWGIAVDFCGGVQSFGTPAYQWMKANAPRFGWVHPSWAEPGGSKPEPWHWEFVG